MDDETPQRIGPYAVKDVIGQHDMAVVLLARDARLDRLVALKALPRHLIENRELAMRLLAEARALAALDHPNIATIHGIEEQDGSSYLVLEYVEGRSLSQHLRKGPLESEEALSIARQVAGALEAAHARGIVHRDLKPANIRITPEGRAKLLDFGLARRLAPAGDSSQLDGAPTYDGPVTAEGTVLGTPGYMSPEQLAGQEVDGRSDIWALGCVLFQCLAGRRPFDGDTFASSTAAALRDEPAWDALPESTPLGVQELLARCLEKQADKRMADCREVRLQLESEFEASDHGPDAVRPAPPARRRHSLRAERDAFVGRDQELDHLAFRLEADARLLTVLGPGGSGKTRLVQRYGWTSLERWPRGVWFCDLSEARSLDGILYAVAGALNVPLGQAAGGRPQVIQVGIAGRATDLDRSRHRARAAAVGRGPRLHRDRQVTGGGAVPRPVDPAKTMFANSDEKLVHTRAHTVGDDTCVFEIAPTTEKEKEDFIAIPLTATGGVRIGNQAHDTHPR